MLLIKILFWVLIAIVLYTYIGYGILLWLLIKLRKRTSPATGYRIDEDLPRVAHIIAAYNEEDFIGKKIDNALSIDYPRHLSRIIIVADGSSDRTTELVKQYPDVELLFQPMRKGKVAAMNRAVELTRDVDILIFSDANTLLNRESFRYIIDHYRDPRVGGVSGEKKVISDGQVPGQGEGLYWKYESVLKKLDSDYYSVVGAAGELFSLRRELFEKVPENIVLDDFYISLNICRRGLMVRYEPNAFAMETPSFSLKDEKKRKLRISAGAFQSMVIMKDLLDITRYGRLAFQYISHRVFRWAVCPFALPLILLLNIIIVGTQGGEMYSFLLAAQVLFYILALLGWLFSGSPKGRFKIFYVPYYFVFMNVSVWGGLVRYLNGAQSAMWEKARRELPT
ncbi:MAG TPA: glycosyltransferase family 2 protein [Chitinophagaceae bacterium]|nr:glycosyltransferase family 2 protein [Chitinophagaceae bacterium]